MQMQTAATTYLKIYVTLLKLCLAAAIHKSLLFALSGSITCIGDSRPNIVINHHRAPL